MDAITALKNMAKAARRTGQDLAAAQIDLCIAEISKNPAMTQHTDEPSVDEMNNIADAMEVCGLSWEPRACLIGNVTAAQIVQVARALRSRLSHPTLSADRNAVIEECGELCDKRAQHWLDATYAAVDEKSRNRALGMWTGFEAAAQHIRALKQ